MRVLFLGGFTLSVLFKIVGVPVIGSGVKIAEVLRSLCLEYNLCISDACPQVVHVSVTGSGVKTTEVLRSLCLEYYLCISDTCPQVAQAVFTLTPMPPQVAGCTICRTAVGVYVAQP